MGDGGPVKILKWNSGVVRFVCKSVRNLATCGKWMETDGDIATAKNNLDSVRKETAKNGVQITWQFD